MVKITKLTRRTFNKIVAGFLTIFGFGSSAQAKTKIDQSCDNIEKEDQATQYMEVVILPEEFRYPYSHKIRQVLYNHMRAGKSRYEIKQWILSHSKVIKVPIK